jgi:LPS-assembly lipoprotein
VVLRVLQDQRERAVVGQTASGQVRELQLRTRFRFNLQTADERILIDDTELLLERDLSFNETQVLAKDAEELLLYRDMTSDIVQQVVRRLAAVDRI